MRAHFLTLLIGACFVLTGCAASPQGSDQEKNSVAPSSEALTFQFATMMNSGQTGTVHIQDNEDGQAVVTLMVTAEDPALYGTEPQLAHIHVGTCDTTLSSPMEFSLMSVRDGKSVTELPISTADLIDATTQLALDLHKSTKESNVITNCVNLK